MYAPSQWETTLQCNVISHWLGAFTKWSMEPFWCCNRNIPENVSIPRLPMPCRLASPVHQQPWYWLSVCISHHFPEPNMTPKEWFMWFIFQSSTQKGNDYSKPYGNKKHLNMFRIWYDIDQINQGNLISKQWNNPDTTLNFICGLKCIKFEITLTMLKTVTMHIAIKDILVYPLGHNNFL